MRAASRFTCHFCGKMMSFAHPRNLYTALGRTDETGMYKLATVVVVGAGSAALR